MRRYALVEFLPRQTAAAPTAVPATLTGSSVTSTPADTSAVAAAALPSVVTITTDTTVTGRFGSTGMQTRSGRPSPCGYVPK